MKTQNEFIFVKKAILPLSLSLVFIFTFSAETYAAVGDFLWANGIGNTSDDIGYSIAVDSSGNVYATGYFRGTVDFDPGPGIVELTSVGVSRRDIFICKFDRSGSLVWARSIGGPSDDEGLSIAVDRAGNVYTTGYYVGTVDFDPGDGIQNRSNNGSSDIFISKLDTNGNFAGAWSMGGTATDYGYGIQVDPSGTIYTTGYFQNTVDFDPNPAPANVYELSSASVGIEDIFISKLNSDGSFAWARSIGGTAADVGLGVSRYLDGNIYITGYFQGNVDFDPGINNVPLSSSGGSLDVFVCKLDSSGNLAWAKRMGGSSWDQAEAVSVDRFGNVYTTGLFNGTADFDPGPATFNLISSGLASDVFISKLDSNGDFVWAKAIGSSSAADVGNDITVDRFGNVITIGNFQGTGVDFDPGPRQYPLDSNGNAADIFISKLDPSGNFVWAGAMGGQLDDIGWGIAVDSSGAVLATGSFRDTADFDPGPGTFTLDSAGTGVVPFPLEDIFICKLAGKDAFPWPMFLPAILGNKPLQP